MDGRVSQMNVDILDLDDLVSQSLTVESLPKKIHHQVHQEMNKS